MATASRGKGVLLQDYLREANLSAITEVEWKELLVCLAPISESYLRRLLHATDLPLSPEVEGIRQDSFQNLERTLLRMAGRHSEAIERGDRNKARECRRAVITAKEHAGLTLRRAGVFPAKKKRREEMILWMRTWLENPGLFPSWLKLRKRVAPPPVED